MFQEETVKRHTNSVITNSVYFYSFSSATGLELWEEVVSNIFPPEYQGNLVK